MDPACSHTETRHANNKHNHASTCSQANLTLSTTHGTQHLHSHSMWMHPDDHYHGLTQVEAEVEMEVAVEAAVVRHGHHHHHHQEAHGGHMVLVALEALVAQAPQAVPEDREDQEVLEDLEEAVTLKARQDPKAPKRDGYRRQHGVLELRLAGTSTCGS